MVLGMTNGVDKGGFIAGGDYNISLNSAYYGQILPTTTALGTNYRGGIGLTTDPTKSGIIASLSDINIGTINSLKLGRYILKY